MPYKDYTKTLECTRGWKRGHPERVKQQKKRYLQIHGQDIREYRREYYLTHKEQVHKYHREQKRKAREEVIIVLGGKCSRCGFEDFRALDIHHKNGGGSQERKGYSKDGKTMINNYQYFRGLLTHLEDLELLCANCHRILD